MKQTKALSTSGTWRSGQKAAKPAPPSENLFSIRLIPVYFQAGTLDTVVYVCNVCTDSPTM